MDFGREQTLRDGFRDLEDGVEELHGRRVDEDVAHLPERGVPLRFGQGAIEEQRQHFGRALAERVEDLFPEFCRGLPWRAGVRLLLEEAQPGLEGANQAA